MTMVKIASVNATALNARQLAELIQAIALHTERRVDVKILSDKQVSFYMNKYNL